MCTARGCALAATTVRAAVATFAQRSGMPVARAATLITPLVTVSSLGHPFIVISDGGFVDGVPGIAAGAGGGGGAAHGGTAARAEIATAARVFVQSLHGQHGGARGDGAAAPAPTRATRRTTGASVLADFEGEMPGWGGELRCAQFMLSTAVAGVTRNPRAPRTTVPGLLLDLGTGPGVELCRQVMEEAALAKLIWGADGDLISLRHQAGLGAMRPRRVIDVQLGYSNTQRRLGMASMLGRVPGSRLSGLPSKNIKSNYAPRRHNRRCLRYPMSPARACYAMDDLHRIEAILLSQKPVPNGNFQKAKSATRKVIASIETPEGALLRIERLVPQNFHRMSEEDQAVTAVRVARGIKHVELLFGSDARLDNALRTRLADALHRVAPAIAPSVIIPDDLSFAPDISDSE